MHDSSKSPLNLDHPQVKDFLAFLSLKNISPEGIKRYRRILRGLFADIREDDLAPSQITSAQVRAFVLKRQEQGLSPSTLSTDVLTLRRFFGFLLQEGYTTTDPTRRLPTPKMGKRLPRVISAADVRRLFASWDDQTSLGRRDKMFFQLCYAGGLRMSEATQLRVENIDWTEGSLRIVGKGDKERRVYLKPAMLDALRQHIAEFRITDLVFPGRRGPISVGRMDVRFNRYVKAAGLQPTMTPHCLRHSIAVHYLMGGAPLTFVQNLLGHSDLATTGIYTRLTDPMVKEVALRIPTAIDAVDKQRKDRTLKEGGAVFAADLQYWSGFVRDIVDW